MRKEDHRPRLIVWQLTEDRSASEATALAGTSLFSEEFTTQECMLTVDSIARASKAIVVLTGPGVMRRPDLFDIVQYSFALGLKVIVEGTPEEITNDLLGKFARFGRRVFRILIDGCVVEGTDTRYDESPQYRALEECIVRMRKAGYEIHFGMTLESVDARQLAFIHDYAFRRSADGLYFHLDWIDAAPAAGLPDEEGDGTGHLIESIANIKQSSPRGMFFSPQCIRYARQDPAAGELPEAGAGTPIHWCHSCVGGKTFAYISPAGKVQVCKKVIAGSGDLRSNEYDFRGLWERSAVFADLRNQSKSCSETRSMLADPHPSVSGEQAA
jgi:hypothetical protein